MSEPPVPTAIVKTGAPEVARDPTTPPPAGATVVPTYALYSRGQIGLATFLTGPLSGCWMIAQNWKRLDEPRKSRRVLVAAIAITAGLFGIAFLVPSMPSSPLPLAGLCAVFGLAAQQRYVYDDHVARGGPRASNGRVVAVAAVSLGVTLAALFAVGVGMYFATRAPEIDLGNDRTVRYLAGGTEDEARAVGSALEHDGLLPHHPVSFGVRRDGSHHVLEIVLAEHAVADVELEMGFRAIAQALSRDAFHGEPVDIWLTDDQFDRQRVLAWTPE